VVRQDREDLVAVALELAGAASGNAGDVSR
jgi:hypothetical protein